MLNELEMNTIQRTYIKPASIAQALEAAAAHPGNFAYIAGGTDVMVNKYQGNREFDCLIDIASISELKQISRIGDTLSIGALLRLDKLQDFTEINEHIPELVTAAREVASPMLRKMATLGGNILCENRCSFYNQSEWWREAIGYCLKCDGDICIATGGRKACFSKFVSDTAPVLIAAGAQIEFHTLDGATLIDLETIYTGDGIHPRNIPETALLSRIFVPICPGRRIIFKKLRPREAVDFTSLTTAVALTADGCLRIAIGGMDPKPVCIESSASTSREDYIKKALARTRAVDNDYYSRNYRREMLRVFLEDSFDELGIYA